jgi:UDP-GlcNAc:undecaprenyl-phosphate/decaprenyl-phosphate GlcNAc-1-phosphate transferase
MNLVAALVAFGVAVVVTPALVVLLTRRGVIDTPTGRSSHSVPIPRGGGLALALGAIAGLIASNPSPREWVILLVAVGFAAIGLTDDLLSSAPLYRLVGHMLVAAAALPGLFDGSGITGPRLLLLAAVALIWQAGYVNAFNFMDGINGISVAQAVVAGMAWIVIGEIEDIPILVTSGVIISAAALGFAPYNFPRAKIFLGDIGSYFLGEWLAVVTIIGVLAGVPPEAMVAPLVIYVVDTTYTLLRRIRYRETWYLPHKNHVYQRLTQVGWSHGRTTLVVGSFMIVCSLLGGLALLDVIAWRLIGSIGVVMTAVAYLVSPRFARKKVSA